MTGNRSPEGGHCEYIWEDIDVISIKTFKVGDTGDGLVQEHVMFMNVREL